MHFVAPEKLPPMPKHVIFVLDTSGSMIGKKMKQTKEAMRAILGQLREQDFFTIITFAEDISIWSATEGLQSVQATTDNLAKALEHVKDIDPRGTYVCWAFGHEHRGGGGYKMLIFFTRGAVHLSRSSGQRYLLHKSLLFFLK